MTQHLTVDEGIGAAHATSRWHYNEQGQQKGPIDLSLLKTMIAAGYLSGTSLVWKVGTKDWSEVRNFPELVEQIKSPPPLPKSVTVAALYADFWTRWLAAPYAGFWKRWLAMILDSLIIFLPCLLMYAIAFDTFGGISVRGDAFAQLVAYIPMWLYFAVMESSKKQATLGKMALGIKVVDLKGNRISFGRASGRFFGKYVSLLTLSIGYLMAGFTKRKQALHDMMAKCLVVNKVLLPGDLNVKKQ